MRRTYVAQQRQLLYIVQKITLPPTDCGEGSPRCPFSSDSSVLSCSSIVSCAPSACDSGSSFSSDSSVLTAAVKALQRAHNQRFHLIKDGHLPSNEGRKRDQFPWICTGLAARRGQRLSEHHRRTDEHDTKRTLQTIIWYKRACISNQRDNLLSLS